MPSLERDGEVFILNLGDGENRFNPEWIAAVGALLEEVSAAPPPRALVTTASGKIWSNGLDLEWMIAHQPQIPDFVIGVHELLARVLELPVPNVAALQGHAFAGGAMLAVAHDRSVMRADRGYFCLPEVDIGIPFTRGMAALLQARLSKLTAHEAMTTGRRYGGEQAFAAGIVHAAVPQEEVLERAIELVAPLAGKSPATLGVIKSRMYAEPLAALRDAVGNGIVPPTE